MKKPVAKGAEIGAESWVHLGFVCGEDVDCVNIISVPGTASAAAVAPVQADPW